jgi:hypothetical protein
MTRPCWNGNVSREVTEPPANSCGPALINASWVSRALIRRCSQICARSVMVGRVSLGFAPARPLVAVTAWDTASGRTSSAPAIRSTAEKPIPLPEASCAGGNFTAGAGFGRVSVGRPASWPPQRGPTARRAVPTVTPAGGVTSRAGTPPRAGSSTPGLATARFSSAVNRATCWFGTQMYAVTSRPTGLPATPGSVEITSALAYMVSLYRTLLSL